MRLLIKINYMGGRNFDAVPADGSGERALEANRNKEEELRTELKTLDVADGSDFKRAKEISAILENLKEDRKRIGM
jgi:hypothetical protein